ncbi:MAG: Fe-S cluster assembly ATPase SufC [Clostridium sp.]|jgi:Fe-S cluster assembly ATP-binding protein|nr:Fe-S cluster assembly ATPase SufC [Clostridium sp.]
MKLDIINLSVMVDNKLVLKDFNLSLDNGKIYVLMGPNGTGKSTLSRVIMGDSNYKVMSGDILFNGNSILDKSVDERSRMGIFLAMQYPMEIEGVSNQDFLRTAMSSKEGKQVGLYDFIMKCEKASEELKMDKNLIHRPLNVGFSGGEKKKNEVLQMKLLKPSLIILDELDSGLDVDSLKIVSSNIKDYIKENKDATLLIITHHQKVLEYIKPDYVKVLYNGKIVDSGDYKLSLEIEEKGYEKYTTNVDTKE